MLILEQITAILAPHICVGCDREGRLLCTDCAQVLPLAVARCYRCQRVSEGGRTCKSCRRQTKLERVRVVARYEKVTKDLVWQLKFERAKAGGKEIGLLLAPLLASEDHKDTLLVHVPTATSRVRRRGYDQAELIAKTAARAAGFSQRTLLVRAGQQRQVGGNREKRRRQMADAFRARNSIKIQNAYIILIDDVITTGATLEAAAAILKAAGARGVEAVVFAQA